MYAEVFSGNNTVRTIIAFDIPKAMVIRSVRNAQKTIYDIEYTVFAQFSLYQVPTYGWTEWKGHHCSRQCWCQKRLRDGAGSGRIYSSIVSPTRCAVKTSGHWVWRCCHEKMRAGVLLPMASPSPATHAIFRLLKAGDSVFQTLLLTKTVVPCNAAYRGAQPLFHALLWRQNTV